MQVRYLDTETTGFGRRDRVVEIVILDEAGSVLLATLVNPQMNIPHVVTNIHGITNSMVKNAPIWAQIEDRVVDILRDSEMVCHNAAFDKRFLGRAQNVMAKTTCTMKMIKTHLKRSFKLAEAAAHIGYKPVGGWHRAEADTLACRALHLWLLDQQVVLLKKSVKQTKVPAVVSDLPRGSSARMTAEERRVFLGDLVPATPQTDIRVRQIDLNACAKPTLIGQAWTPEDDKKLLEWWKEGLEIADITQRMPRTPRGLVLRLELLGAICPDSHGFLKNR